MREFLLVTGKCGPDCVQRGALKPWRGPGGPTPESRVKKPGPREGRELTQGHASGQL